MPPTEPAFDVGSKLFRSQFIITILRLSVKKRRKVIPYFKKIRRPLSDSQNGQLNIS